MTCPVCNGDGIDPNTVTENLKGDPCGVCGGSGALPVKEGSGPEFSPEEIERRRAS